MLAAGLFSASCSDFLTEDPKGQLDPKTYYNSADAVNSAVYALYTQVNVSQIYTNMLYPQWQGDDITANPASNKQAVAEIDGFSASNNNKGVREAWEKNYKIIEAANNIINNIKYDENTVYANTAKEAVGQAHSGVHLLTITWCVFMVRCPLSNVTLLRITRKLLQQSLRFTTTS